MAFCSKCGQQLADGVGTCPACGAPIDAAPAAAPQNPAYNSGPEHLDFIPSSNSASFPKAAYVGIAAAVLGFVLTFIDVTSSPRIYYLIYAISAACGAFAMFQIFDSLKKGLAGHKKPMPGLLSTTGWFYVIANALFVIGGLIAVLAGLNGLGAALAVIGVGGFVSFVYLILLLIVAFTLIGSYTGNLKTFGWLLFIPVIIGLIGVIGALGGKVFTIIVALISCAFTIYIYLFAKKIISDGK